MAQKITVRNNQSLLDIAVQESGAFEAVIDLMEQNNLAITDTLAAGQQVEYMEQVQNTDIKGYYKGNNLHPATGLTLIDTEGSGGQGISIWGIGVDFIISG